MATETFELRIDGMHFNEYTENVLHFSGVGVDPDDTYRDAQSLINGWKAALEALFLAMLPATYHLISYASRRWQNKPSSVAHQVYISPGQAGTGGSLGEATQLCPVIFLVPTMGTKSGGKIFLPAVPQGSIIGNQPQAAWVTAVQAFEAALISGFTNDGMTWTSVVASHKTGVSSTVISAHLSPVIGYQRKRRSPVGIT